MKLFLLPLERVQEDQPKEPPGCKQREAEKELSNGIYEISLEKRMGRRKKGTRN